MLKEKKVKVMNQNHGFKNQHSQKIKKETSYRFYGPTAIKPMMS